MRSYYRLFTYLDMLTPKYISNNNEKEGTNSNRHEVEQVTSKVIMPIFNKNTLPVNPMLVPPVQPQPP